MKHPSDFDVIIIGAGITGLSTAWHLQKSGRLRLGLANSPLQAPMTLAASGIITGGQTDNYSRVAHAHGSDFAASFWRFGDMAFDALLSFCEAEQLFIQRQRRLRLITSPSELREAHQAVQALQEHGLTGALLKPQDSPPGDSFTNRVLAVQDDGPRGAVTDTAPLLAKLNAAVQGTRLTTVSAISTDDRGVRVLLHGGQEVRTEIVVLANHLAIGDLIPSLKSSLVSVADQWSLVRSEKPLPLGLKAGLVFSANHTYEWGAILDKQHLCLGGGRYLRPMAGIEATAASAEAHITEHLLEQSHKTFKLSGDMNVLTTHGFLDCRPCDELPIIGPMFGESRILVATGFMGSGLSLGFYSGACLAKLITTGQCDELLRRLWPERLRSLES